MALYKETRAKLVADLIQVGSSRIIASCTNSNFLYGRKIRAQVVKIK